MSGAGPTVGTVKCRGGCGRELDLELHPDGECEPCAAEAAAKNGEAWREGF